MITLERVSTARFIKLRYLLTGTENLSKEFTMLLDNLLEEKRHIFHIGNEIIIKLEIDLKGFGKNTLNTNKWKELHGD